MYINHDLLLSLLNILANYPKNSANIKILIKFNMKTVARFNTKNNNSMAAISEIFDIFFFKIAIFI